MSDRRRLAQTSHHDRLHEMFWREQQIKLVELLRSDLPLSRNTRDEIADELARFYKLPGQSKRDKHEYMRSLAELYRSMIYKRAAELKRAGVSNPVEEAEKQLAPELGFGNCEQSGKMLNRWIRRQLSPPGQKRP